VKPRASLITLGVSDLARSVRFYRDGLRLPLRKFSKGIAFFVTRGTWLSLCPNEAMPAHTTTLFHGTGLSGFAIAHNVRSLKEVDTVLDQAKGAGAKVIEPIWNVSWGGYTGHFADPDGYLWEVAWKPDFPIELCQGSECSPATQGV
jgi:catechol 2,3-dioxygenase-like lactoylglutathione lyase family enzyme